MRLRTTDLTWREIDGELVILDLRKSNYLTTNGSGAILMQQLTEERTPADLAATLVGVFGIDKDRATTDAHAFIDMLDQNGLLTGAV